MRRQRQKAQARAQGAYLAQEINVPLPVKGLFEDAKNKEVSGAFTWKFKNVTSTGTSIHTRRPYTLTELPIGDLAGRSYKQYIPFEFGGLQGNIRVDSTSLGFDDVDDFARSNTGTFVATYISGYAVMVDGGGDPVLFNGTTFSSASFTTDTDVTADEFDGVIAHHDRLYFWKTGGTLEFYYGDIGAITGELTRFPLDRLGNITGQVLSLFPMTLDAGHGMNDVLAIITTTGHIVIYEGLNPGDSLDWRQSSRVRVTPPISHECLIQVAGDIWMLTAGGIISVTSSLREGAASLLNTITAPIQETITELVDAGGTWTRWSMHVSADANLLIINAFNERSDDGTQFLYRTDTKSWEETDYPARVWHNLGRETQFLGDADNANYLYRLEPNYSGVDYWRHWQDVTSIIEIGWFRLKKDAQIAYIKPTIMANGPVQVKAYLLTDHNATQADYDEAEQVVTLNPEGPLDNNVRRVALKEEIAVDGTGSVFLLRLEITAKWMEIVNLQAAVL